MYPNEMYPYDYKLSFTPTRTFNCYFDNFSIFLLFERMSQ